MRERTKRQLEWSTKLYTTPGLADDIADLLINHSEGCVSRLAAQYWLDLARWPEADFLQDWLNGEFDA